MTDRPVCEDERNASSGFTCAKDHCPRCGAHRVYSAPAEGTLRCRLEGSCQAPIEQFA